MDILDLIKSRVSIRRYKTDPVPFETVLSIVEAARYAPSWGNKQCWSFVIVDSKVEKTLIGKATGQANISKACEDAPYVIVLCANPKDSGIKNGTEYYLFDSACAMENLVLAAQGAGLSTCIVAWFDEKTIRGVLNIPEGVRVVAFTPLGYSDESVLTRTRKKQEDTVFHNYWRKEIK